jgi:hypothetical protein
MLVTCDVGRYSIVRVRITQQIRQSGRKNRREISNEIACNIIIRHGNKKLTNDWLTIRKHFGQMKSGGARAHRKKCVETRGSHAEQRAMTYYIMIIWSKFVKILISCLHTISGVPRGLGGFNPPPRNS